MPSLISNHLRRATALLMAGSVIMGACSSGGDDAAPATTAGKPATTTASTTTASTTIPSELDASLPTAADLGAGWEAEPVAPAAVAAQLERADRQFRAVCPVATDFVPARDYEGARAATFVRSSGQAVAVVVAPSNGAVGPTDREAYMKAIRPCTSVQTDPKTGIKATVSLKVTAAPYGAQGLLIENVTTYEGGNLPRPVVASSHSIDFFVGSTSVLVHGRDHLDQKTGAVEPLDPELLSRLAASLERRLDKVTD